MSFFAQSGDAFVPTAGKDTLFDSLPVGNYVVAQSMSGLFYMRAPKFAPLGKVYGDVEARADRILHTFDTRPRATGALFSGEKGSGKSLLARMISLKGYELGIPTILVNSPWTGDGFANLLADVEQPAIVLMDEFEKVYDSNEQEQVLTLLDGSMTTKKLFILTVNNKWRVDSNMRNRPGRLYYSIDFDGLESTFVKEYCEDNLDNQEHVDLVVKVSTMFEKFNFDMLTALVEEMNRYDEDPFDALKLLNAKPVDHEPGGKTYEVKVFTPDGVEGRVESREQVTPLNAHHGTVAIYVAWPAPKEEGVKKKQRRGDPLLSLDEMFDDVPDDGNKYLQARVYWKAADVTKLNAEAGEYEFINEDGYRITYKQIVSVDKDLRSMWL